MAGSNSSTSINHQLVAYTVSRIKDHSILLRDLASLQLPVYDADVEKEEGFPEGITSLFSELRSADGWIFSVNEHNGNPSAYTKSLLDWFSRKERHFAKGIPVLLMSASPGRGGAAGSQEVVARMLADRFGASALTRFTLPSFRHTFDPAEGILDPELEAAHQRALKRFLEAL